MHLLRSETRYNMLRARVLCRLHRAVQDVDVVFAESITQINKSCIKAGFIRRPSYLNASLRSHSRLWFPPLTCSVSVLTERLSEQVTALQSLSV